MSQISSIWGKKSSHQMIIPPEQQRSMKRFLTPSRQDSEIHLLDPQNSIQKLRSNRKMFQDESKEKIVDFKHLSQQFDMVNKNKQRNSGNLKLPKIRSMSLNQSYKFLNKNHSMHPGMINSQSGITNQYNSRNEMKKNVVNFNSTIKEVTGENFFTKYGEKFNRDGNSTQDGRTAVNEYHIDEEAKVICFCQQRLGRQTKCPHAEIDDVDEISTIICEQAQDFMSADKHTAEDILMIKSGLEKVEFVRSQNYLAKLAVLISQQEKEIFKLQKKAHQHKVISAENVILKNQIDKLKNKLDKQNDIADNCKEDKNYMSMKVQETNFEMTSLLDKLREENRITNDLQQKVKMQEIEIRTLIECVENLRKTLVDQTEKNKQSQVNPEYQKYDQLLQIYANSAKMLEKIKRERKIDIQKDVFDLAMLRISKQTEIEMLNLQMKQMMQDFAEDIDWQQLGIINEEETQDLSADPTMTI